METDRLQRVLCIGEALYDCFPDRRVLGGAPLNVAVHLRALLEPLGGDAVLLTRVGDDPFGRELLADLRRRGLDTSAVQIDAEWPTGTVEVKPRGDGETSYRFPKPVAWDRLKCTDVWKRMTPGCAAICFGTLAQREPASAEAIRQLRLAAPDAIALLDVNLRQDFFDADTLDCSFTLADAAKLNVQELDAVTKLLGLPAEVAALEKRYHLNCIAVTQGARGTALHSGGECFTADVPAITPAPGADAVGAGDACTAGLLFGGVMGWEPAATVRLANALGAFVASQPGATPTLPPQLLALSRSSGGS